MATDFGNEGTVSPYGNFATLGLPDETIIIETYHEMGERITAWANGIGKSSLIILGAAGIGKSESCLAALNRTEKPYLYLKGDASKYGVYQSLYHHRDEPVLLDDLDELMSDSGVTTILKSLCETRDEKIIQRTTGATMKDDSELPPSFTTKSKACLLVNELKQATKNFGAVLNRSTVYYFKPNCAEVINYVRSWFDMKNHKDVFDFVSERLPMATEPSCRYFYKAADWKEIGIDWKSQVERMIRPTDARAALVRELQADKTLKTEKAREAEWNKRTGQSRQAYYAVKKALALKDGTLTTKQLNQSKALKKKHAAKKKAK